MKLVVKRVDIVSTMETKRVARRKHSADFRAEVVLACRQPGASVAAIALRSGLNANVVYHWLSEGRQSIESDIGKRVELSAASCTEFIPVQMPHPGMPKSTDIRLEFAEVHPRSR